jgi:carbon-monoxide dehydrogenase medium subunit
MIPNAFEYARASSVDEAVRLLQAAGGEGKLLAGGHSLLPIMKLRLTEPAKLIDIGRIAELRGVNKVDDTLVIGALTTHYQVASHPLVKKYLPVLAEVASQIGDLQVRNRGTIGGNLAHADMASDLPAVALALEATLHVATPDGAEEIAAKDFFLGPLTTAMPEYGLLTSVSFPIPPAHCKGVYEKFPHPASGYAVVGVAAVAGTGDDGRINYARVAITGAGDVVYRARAVEDALLGSAPSEDVIREAASHAADDGSIVGDPFASEEYRRHLCSVYTAKALRRLFG